MVAVDHQVSYKQYEFIIDNVNDIIFQTDTKGNWSFLSKSWERSMGFTVTESLGHPFFNFLHADDVSKNYEYFIPLLDGRKAYCSHEIRYVSKSNDIIWMRVYAVLLKDDKGQVIGTSGTLCDISKEKQNQNIIELLSNNISDVVILHEIDGTHNYISPSIFQATGYTENELLGKSPYDFVFAEDLDLVKKYHTDLMKNKSNNVESVTFRFVTKSGGYTWMESVPKFVINDLGDVVGVVTSSRVVDVRKKAEEQLLITFQKESELNQLKSSFINMASHEFRTPLAIIHSSLELIDIYSQNPAISYASTQKHINGIYAEIDRLNSLIDDVLITGKIDSNTIVCNNELFNIVDLVECSISSIEDTQADNRKVELIIEGQPRNLNADPVLMRQVLYNLLSNAFKYSAGRKPPKLKLLFTETEIVIKIRDYGIGIPEAEGKKIFSAFFRASNTGQIKGTGLGMFITKKFTEIQKGAISFKSFDGVGSEFKVTFKQ